MMRFNKSQMQATENFAETRSSLYISAPLNEDLKLVRERAANVYEHSEEEEEAP